MQKLILRFAILLCTWPLNGQQTVGVFVHTPDAFPGYTLFAPTTSRSTYLIDNCGRLIHQWNSNFVPGLSVYLLEDGSLLRTARINSTFQSGGGSGGRIEHYDWDGNLRWAYHYSSATFHQHHDIEPLPNGNILILAWEKISTGDAIEAGRDPGSIPSQGLWSEHIVEVRPGENQEAEIVWEWHAWDHLVQDFDASKVNYGDVAAHPEKLDLNYRASGMIVQDWLHCNSIDYHPGRDQILLSCLNFNEVWIIDHSTTSEEAAGEEGGLYGHGGDLLYRWGNPQTYRMGNAGDRVLFGQHDAKWIEDGIPGEGLISVYNNSHGSGSGSYSSADLFRPPVDSTGSYVRAAGTAFGPVEPEWTYTGMPDQTFHSQRMSGVQRLPNGNTLISVANTGKFMEVGSGSNIVWEYVNPITVTGPVSQGALPVPNTVFRAERYPVDHPAFAGKNLDPQEPLELNPLPLNCPDSTVSTRPMEAESQLMAMPNPVGDRLIIRSTVPVPVSADVFINGQSVASQVMGPGGITEFNTRNWLPGLVIIVLTETGSRRISILKVLKL